MNPLINNEEDEFEAAAPTPYNTAVNYDYLLKPQAQSDIVSDITGGAVASVVDFGATLWNSLPFTEEVETGALLERINDNAANVYAEHPDAVHTASFIGGMLVPGGVALKGMNAWRNGTKAANWFSAAGKEQSLAKLVELKKAGSDANAAYKAARNSFYARGVANQVADAAGMELLIGATFNAHPFMEDYFENPIQHIGTSLLLGGVLGGGIGLIADRALLRGTMGAVESQAIKIAADAVGDVQPGLTQAGKIQIRQDSIEALETILRRDAAVTNEGPVKLNPLAKEFTEKILLEERAKQVMDFESMASSTIKAASKDFKDSLMQRLSKDTRFAPAESVNFLKFSEAKVGAKTKDVAKLTDKIPEFFAVKKFARGPKKGTEIEIATPIAYSQEFNRFGPTNAILDISRANALKGVSEESILRASAKIKTSVQVPNFDIGLEILGANSPSIDRLYLERLAAVDKLKPEDLQTARVNLDDLPMINALLAKIAKQPADMSEVRITVTAKDPREAIAAESLKSMTPAQLMNHLLIRKEALIKSLLKQGRSFEEIAIKSNTPVSTVRAWATGDKAKGTLALHGAPIEYGNATEISSYLDLNKAPLLFKSSMRKIEYAKMQASLDTALMNDAARLIAEGVIQTSKSGIAREVGAMFYGDSMSKLMGILRHSVTEAVPDKAGTKFFQSTDFYSRAMKDLGPMATIIGQQVQATANRVLNSLLREPSLHMGRIAKNPAALSEINTAVALNASLSKWRVYQDRQFWQKVKKLGADGKEVEELEAATFRGQPFKVVSDDVDNFLRSVAPVGRELYELASTKASLVGKPNMPDIGFWLPSINPRNKHVAYVHDLATATTRTLWGNSADELQAAISAFKPTVADKLADGSVKIVLKADQEAENLLIGRTDVMDMMIADVQKYHSGASAPAIVKANADILGEIAGSLEHYVQASVRDIASVVMYDTMDALETISKVNRRMTDAQPLGPITKFLNKPNDPASVMRNTLLGVSNAKEYEPWQWMNQGFEAVTGYALTKISKTWQAATSQIPKFKQTQLPTQDRLAGMDYKKFSEALEKEGIVNPYEGFTNAISAELFNVAKLTEAKNLSPRLVYASNALAATAALRFGEIAQPLVNAMSLPILMMSAVSAKMPQTFLGAKLATASSINPMAAMYDGIRAMNSKHFEHWGKKWEAAGDFDSMVSEASKVLKLPREFEPGIIAATERALDSRLVEIMSRPADWSESLVRRTAMYTGGALAKKLYPELDDNGITIFARHFKDRVVGNYNAAQRPVFFQGTLGTAAGLFQTYMVTMAQSMYGHLELRNFKAIAKTMLTQQGIFGMGSLPGFDLVSEQIGEHFSEDHVDLQSGTFRALPDTVATGVLYGLPSALGPAFYSRGELAPRVPNLATGIINLPSVNMAGQAIQAIGSVASAIGESKEDIPRHIGQALGMQSISRPIARISELATGYSITRPGRTIATPDEVWTTTSVLSRLIGTRPTSESVLRDTIHLDSVYGTIDREGRTAAINELRTAIRGGTLDDAKLSEIAEAYMRNGTPTGWRSALRTALAQTDSPASVALRDKLGEDHPLNYMIDGLDNQ